ncbi:MAG: hypothetical protein K6F94_07925 [Bacteroidaceae bacterium]|nr:hypothetical protein [Bacteroidaceae bacterium]
MKKGVFFLLLSFSKFHLDIRKKRLEELLISLIGPEIYKMGDFYGGALLSSWCSIAANEHRIRGVADLCRHIIQVVKTGIIRGGLSVPKYLRWETSMVVLSCPHGAQLPPMSTASVVLQISAAISFKW